MLSSPCSIGRHSPFASGLAGRVALVRSIPLNVLAAAVDQRGNGKRTQPSTGPRLGLHPGIRIAFPLIPEADYLSLTDHMPLVLTLRTGDATVPLLVVSGDLRIAGVLPNPVGADRDFEEVRVRNVGSCALALTGWRITNGAGLEHWLLTAEDGTVEPGQTVVIVRKARPMSLSNSGDTVVLISPAGQTTDMKAYGPAPVGQLFEFR